MRRRHATTGNSRTLGRQVTTRNTFSEASANVSNSPGVKIQDSRGYKDYFDKSNGKVLLRQSPYYKVLQRTKYASTCYLVLYNVSVSPVLYLILMSLRGGPLTIFFLMEVGVGILLSLRLYNQAFKLRDPATLPGLHCDQFLHQNPEQILPTVLGRFEGIFY